MPEVEVQCPQCKKIGKIYIQEETIESSSRGVVAVLISANRICAHSFIVYIDNNLIARDYYTTDFQIERSSFTQDFPKEKSIYEKDQLDLDLIKLTSS